MERELIISGLGGQGIQVTGALLGHAAVAENKRAMFFAMFDGAQRGGISECVVAMTEEERIIAPPTMLQPVSAAICMHPNAYFRFERWIKPGGLLAYNSSIRIGTRPEWMAGAGHGAGGLGTDKVEIEHTRDDIAYLPIPASETAQEEVGNVLVASLIALSAFTETTGVVGLDALKNALREAIRPGRHKFIPINEQALDLGKAFVQEDRIEQREALKLF